MANLAEPVRIVTIVGARPQFIKAAPVSRAIAERDKRLSNCTIVEKIVHTSQHYDENMSKTFFDELKIPRPHYNLGVGSDTHGAQTGKMLEKIEQVLLKEKPDWCLVYGDTNSTLAGALASAKLHISVAHVEAGLRSFNRRTPEEINRVATDHLSSFLLCPTYAAITNLEAEGITQGVYQVGDVMYDSVLFNIRLAERSSFIMQRLGLTTKSFYLATIHRAENTDDHTRMNGILAAFARLKKPIILPLHPRTKKALGSDLGKIGTSIRVIEPVSYFDMLILEKNARVILTDSGGVQKEAYWFRVPCVTLRDETEWVELVHAGWNAIVGSEPTKIQAAVAEAEKKVDRGIPDGSPDLYGKGHSAERIVSLLACCKGSPS